MQISSRKFSKNYKVMANRQSMGLKAQNIFSGLIAVTGKYFEGTVPVKIKMYWPD